MKTLLILRKWLEKVFKRMDDKGQIFSASIVVFLALLIFIFASPALFEIISISVEGQGTATVFSMKLFLWVIFLSLLALMYKVIGSGEGFF